MKKEKSILLLISAIIGTLYSLYLVSHFWIPILTSTNIFEQIGIKMVESIVRQHIILVIIATGVTWYGYIKKDKIFTLISGIVFIIAGISFTRYIAYVVPSAILSLYVYYKIIEENKKNDKEKKAPLYLN